MLKKTKDGEVCMEPAPPKDRYSCPVTGAHFRVDDLCKMLLGLDRNELRWFKEFPSESKKVRKNNKSQLAESVVQMPETLERTS